MKFWTPELRRVDAELVGRTSTRRSIRYEASVTRNEQRYATPPGALFVYAPWPATCAAGMS